MLIWSCDWSIFWTSKIPASLCIVIPNAEGVAMADEFFLLTRTSLVVRVYDIY